MGTLYSARAKRKAINHETAREALIQIVSVANATAAGFDLQRGVDPKWAKETLETIAKRLMEIRQII